MDIRYRLYPYPVLSAGNDDYVDSSFSFDLNVNKGIRSIIIQAIAKLNNKEIQDLIDNNKLEYVLHIECPYTCYREVVKSTDKIIEKEIPEKMLDGKVAVCLFIVAKKNLYQYKNSLFNSDYKDIAFDIERGGILAIGGQVNIDITKDSEELAKVPSIFTICRNAADTDENMKINIDGDKIAITLSNNSFKNYTMLSSTPIYVHVLHSMILFPALIYVFEILYREDLEDFEYRRWYKAIKKTLEKYNLNLNKELLEQVSSYELAQKLLDLPVTRALDAITSLDTYGEDEL